MEILGFPNQSFDGCWSGLGDDTQEMPGRAICLWTLRGLVSAFFDLALAYFLLSGAALAYFASIFLRIFGLGFPCPCHQFFGYPALDRCWKGTLVSGPLDKISGVQLSVKNKFPFDSIWSDHDLDCRPNAKSLKRIYIGDKCDVGLKSEVSHRSWNEEIGGRTNLVGVEEAAFGLKSKAASPRDSYLKLCRNGAVHLKKIALDDPLKSLASAAPPSPNDDGNGENDGLESTKLSVKPRDAKPSSEDFDLPKSTSHCEEKVEPLTENMPTVKDPAAGMFKSSSLPDLACCHGNQESFIQILEKALEKEYNARTALYLELENERSAAATAADEAMAMILRLQEEKAEIEMDARQYQRIIEEKSAYDIEEMNILKEILIRREREKHFLEEEVEGYRQMLLEREQWDVDGYGQGASSVYSSEDFGLMSPKISELVGDQKEKEANVDDYINQGLQEKGRTSTEQDVLGKEGHFPIPIQATGPQRVEVPEDHLLVVKEGEQCDNFPSKDTKASDEPKIILAYDNHTVVKQRKSMSAFDYERSKIDNEVGWLREGLKSVATRGNGNKNQSMQRNSPVLHRQTSDSERIVVPRPLCSSPGSAAMDFQGKSMSAFDNERSKIDSEVGWLRERLKHVQQGRGKLKLSGGLKGREKSQMQILDDIASQLREIRHLTEPGKVLKKAALPPLSSKAMQKRRPNRSTSLEVGKIL